jgi:hypothetical protein
MTVPLDPAGLQALYNKQIAGRRAWLDYHLPPHGRTPFGRRLLAALATCEARQPGLGRRLVKELAAVKHVPGAADEEGWKAGFEQLIQKLAEILVARVLCDMPWPEGTRIECEPRNRKTGKRPEFVVITPERTWLFEVKCPAFIKHQAGRNANRWQLPVRSFLRDMPDATGPNVTLPRDNVLKDFLASAEEKFVDFADGPRTAILVVVWDSYMYEAVGVLTHEETGLLTERSWLRADGDRIAFSSVDGVLIINRQAELSAATREEFDCLIADPFAMGGPGSMANVWCPNVGAGELDPLIAEAFDAWPVDGVSWAADYAKMDYEMWFNPAEQRRRIRRQRRLNALKGSASPLAFARAAREPVDGEMAHPREARFARR